MRSVDGFERPESTRPLVSVDVVIFALRENDLQVLLVCRERPPFAEMWAIPGGFVGPNEGLQAAASLKLEQETGLADVYLEQLYTFGEPTRDPRDRVITVAYFAVVRATRIVPRATEDSEHVRWWSIYHLPQLAFDHGDILTYALRRLRYKLEYTAVGFELLPDEFTLTALQTAYEIVLGEELDKRNFRRKILAAGIIEPSGRVHAGGKGRPAQLYRYREASAEVKARRLFPELRAVWQEFDSRSLCGMLSSHEGTRRSMVDSIQRNILSRRQFVAGWRLSRATLLALWHRNIRPATRGEARGTAGLRRAGPISPWRGNDPKTITRAALRPLANERFVHSGDDVISSRTSAWIIAATNMATTNPDVLATLVELCLGVSARQVR
jgi:8-oxo-dGTP diphosphatase